MHIYIKLAPSIRIYTINIQYLSNIYNSIIYYYLLLLFRCTKQTTQCNILRYTTTVVIRWFRSPEVCSREFQRSCVPISRAQYRPAKRNNIRYKIYIILHDRRVSLCGRLPGLDGGNGGDRIEIVSSAVGRQATGRYMFMRIPMLYYIYTLRTRSPTTTAVTIFMENIYNIIMLVVR